MSKLLAAKALTRSAANQNFFLYHEHGLAPLPILVTVARTQYNKTSVKTKPDPQSVATPTLQTPIPPPPPPPKVSKVPKASLSQAQWAAAAAPPIQSPPPKSPPDDSTKSTKAPPPPPGSSKVTKLVLVGAIGIVTYFVIDFIISRQKPAKALDPSIDPIDYTSPYLAGKVVPTKSIKREKNPDNIKITLYQHVTCPFCCKVRAYLDYYGYSYDIVEVNSMSKKELGWTANRKGVPTLAVRIPKDNDPGKYELLQINDSTLIVSTLESLRLDPNQSLRQLLRFYDPLKEDTDPSHKDLKLLNSYFVMFSNGAKPDTMSVSERRAEREWRTWVDDKFLHAVAPNVYRTISDTLAAFDWYDQVGEWSNVFTSFERTRIKYGGTAIMYLLANYKLKKKYGIKDDPRESLYEYCKEWTDSLQDSQPLRGGDKPDLSDLMLYGVISSFEGCSAFRDMMANTKIKRWHEACKAHVTENRGAALLNAPLTVTKAASKAKSANSDTKPVTKSRKYFYFF